MKLLMTTFALGFLLAAAGTHAQVVYKSTMADGKVIYSEKPAPGARRVDKIESPPPKSGITAATPEEMARAEQLAKERAAAAAAAASGKQVSIDELRKQLQKAEAARDGGKEPLASERLGTVGGKSRLTDDYFSRQKGLEQAVADARKRLEDAQKGVR